MALYDKASLVLIPSGTKEGVVFSQKPTNGDGDFTFTRASSATRVNSDGLIEKETQNIVLYSNDFSQSNWVQVSTTRTSGESGYDGTNDAWELVRSSGGTLILNQALSLSGVYTLSCYVKINASNGFGIGFSSSAYALFNISDALQTSAVFTNNLISSSITYVGNNFYRITVTGNGSFNQVRLINAVVNGSSTSSGGGTHIVQDVQIEQGLVARDYIETTTTAVEGGITDNVPRLDYTDSSCPALLLEPLRTNLVTNSEWLEGGFSLANGATLSLENVTAPDGSNLVTKVQANSDDAGRAQDGLGTLGTNHIWSGFFKGTGVATRLRFRNNQGKQVQYNINASGDFSLYSEDAVNGNYDIEDYGNGWHRIWFETTTTGATSNFVQIYPDVQNGTGSVYAWGLQAEAGSYATSYIPTYGSSVSRVDDFCATSQSGNADFGSGDFSVFFDVEDVDDDGSGATALVGNRQSGEWWRFYGNKILNRFHLEMSSSIGGYTATIIGSYEQFVDGRNKVVISRNSNRLLCYVNGVEKINSTSAVYLQNFDSTNTKIELNSWNDGATANTNVRYNQLLIFKGTALTPSECQSLTTI